MEYFVELASNWEDLDVFGWRMIHRYLASSFQKCFWRTDRFPVAGECSSCYVPMLARIWMNLGIAEIIQGACAIRDDELSILERLLSDKSTIAPLLTEIFHNDIIATII